MCFAGTCLCMNEQLLRWCIIATFPIVSSVKFRKRAFDQSFSSCHAPSISLKTCPSNSLLKKRTSSACWLIMLQPLPPSCTGLLNPVKMNSSWSLLFIWTVHSVQQDLVICAFLAIPVLNTNFQQSQNFTIITHFSRARNYLDPGAWCSRSVEPGLILLPKLVFPHFNISISSAENKQCFMRILHLVLGKTIQTTMWMQRLKGWSQVLYDLFPSSLHCVTSPAVSGCSFSRNLLSVQLDSGPRHLCSCRKAKSEK